MGIVRRLFEPPQTAVFNSVLPAFIVADCFWLRAHEWQFGTDVSAFFSAGHPLFVDPHPSDPWPGRSAEISRHAIAKDLKSYPPLIKRGDIGTDIAMIGVWDSAHECPDLLSASHRDLVAAQQAEAKAGHCSIPLIAEVVRLRRLAQAKTSPARSQHLKYNQNHLPSNRPLARLQIRIRHRARICVGRRGPDRRAGRIGCGRIDRRASGGRCCRSCRNC